MAKRKRLELRVSDDQYTLLKRTAQDRGYRSISAYVLAALTKDLRDSHGDRFDGVEAFVASLDRLSKEIRTTHTAQQAVFAAIDSLVRLLLTCIPEPPPEVLDQAKRRARLRYDRFLLAVAQNMTSDSRVTLTELMDRC
jgi:Protein of unknown function (DUF1778)